MTIEEKDLLFKDLCSRLPYGVAIDCREEDTRFTCYLTTDILREIQNNTYHWEYKPYLFPFSSMTLEQRWKAQNLLPDKCEISFTNSKIEFYGEDYHKIKLEQFDNLFNLFNMWHLDYRGLIPMGLANDATNLNIY